MAAKKEDIIILGGSGHAKVVAATALDCGYHVQAFYDDNPEKHSSELLGIPIIGEIKLIKTKEKMKAIVAVGDNRLRSMITQQYQECCKWINLVHPRSYVHPSVKLGVGTVVFAGACIQPDAVIGEHCIINTGSTIDHDCNIEDYVHIGPGVNLAGNVTVGKGTLLGAGGTIIPGKKVANWSIVGAGAVILEDISEPGMAVGVPARVIKRL